MSRSIVSQIFSGLAYAAGGFLVLGIFLSFLPSQCFPKELMPPKEGLYLKYVHLALWTYSLDHEGRYPERLDEIVGDDVLRGDRRDMIHSHNLKYVQPKFSESDPFNKRNESDILIYETDKWYFSVTIQGTMSYHRKKDLTKPSTRPLPAVTADAEAHSSPASSALAVRGE